MTLLVLAYPEISAADYARLQAFRQAHDALYYGVVEPHFTLVFPLSDDWTPDALMAEVTRQAAGYAAFDFCLCCATLNKDAFNDYYHVFLVPDEGYSRLVKLHDQLYAGQLFAHRALHIDFIPHIGVGNAPDPHACLALIDHWNQTDFAIHGRITALEVAAYENNSVTTLHRLSLATTAQ